MVYKLPDNISQAPAADTIVDNVVQPSPLLNQSQTTTHSPMGELSKLASRIDKQEKEVEKINVLLFLGFCVVLIMTATLLFMFGTVLVQSWEDKTRSNNALLEKVDSLKTQLQLQERSNDY